MKAWVLYAAFTAGIVAGGAWLLGLLFESAEQQRALRISAVIAFVVQVTGFAIARRMRRNILVGWGIGAAMCMISLIAFGFVAQATGLPIEAALLSLAAFYFATELMEPLLLTV